MRPLKPQASRSQPAHGCWLLVFGVWILLLSGWIPEVAGSPGISQAVKLRLLLKSKNQDLSVLENQMIKLEADRKRLEENPHAQEREIRRVLGYVAPGETIFDLTSAVARY